MDDKNAIDQVLGTPPSWMLRWGMVVLALFFVLLTAIAWFVQYPDTVTAPVRLHTETLPVRLTMPISGRIDTVLVTEAQAVSKGTVIAVLASSTQLQDILQIEPFLQNGFDGVFPTTIPPIGSLTPLWSQLVLHQQQKQQFLQQNKAQRKNQQLQQQISKLQKLHQTLLQQQRTLQQKVDLALQAKQRDETLQNTNAASPIEVEQSTQYYLNTQQALEQLSTELVRNELDIQQLRAAMLDMDLTAEQGLQSLEYQIEKDKAQLQTAIEEWKSMHLIRSPISGNIHVDAAWALGQHLAGETPLFTVTPPYDVHTPIVATAFLKQQNLGKVQLGADVHIHLNAYPYQEFGILKGTVNHLSSISENGVYAATIAIPQKLITSYQKTIPFRQEMEGQAEIISQKRRLLARFFDRIWSIRYN